MSGHDRRIPVTISATIVLAPAEYYEGLSIHEQILADMESDPAAFVLEQIEDMEIVVED